MGHVYRSDRRFPTGTRPDIALANSWSTDRPPPNTVHSLITLYTFL
ncbi:uncharacterized protein G2W53_041975 [Senna tora]|uniref:Uncharacterized protein n=1 Tax=Senna tora TaxID=362788 RepID=A0A834W3D5_9FABA|nr:uncharacterized protein G2W53_041975 [Senna tora]